MAKQRFTTLDIYLAGYLEYRGIHAELEHQGTRVIFTFPQSDELYKLTSAFNSNDSIPVTDYVSSIRTLRAKMFSAREHGAADLTDRKPSPSARVGVVR